MPAVGDRNTSCAATIAEPFARVGDCWPAGNLVANPNLHVVYQSEPAGDRRLLQRGGNRQPVDRLHHRLLHRQVGTRQPNQFSRVSSTVPRQARISLRRALRQTSNYGAFSGLVGVTRSERYRGSEVCGEVWPGSSREYDKSAGTSNDTSSERSLGFELRLSSSKVALIDTQHRRSFHRSRRSESNLLTPGVRLR
jgi:hypothetical protein